MEMLVEPPKVSLITPRALSPRSRILYSATRGWRLWRFQPDLRTLVTAVIRHGAQSGIRLRDTERPVERRSGNPPAC